MPKFQIVSDLHIEYRNDEIPDPLSLITPTAENLILAGDIGSLYKFNQLKGFLESLCIHFKNVLYVPGNHEFYMVPNSNIDPVPFNILVNRLYLLEKNISNLYILNQYSVIIDDVCITGCTLWTKAEVNIPKFIVRIHGMNNFLYEQRYQSDLKYIKKMINYCNKNKLKLVVVTHHCPTYKVIDSSEYKNKDKYVSLYVSKLDYLLEKDKIDTWICGHVHYNFDFISDGGTRIVGNQRGKPRDNITDYCKDFVLTFEEQKNEKKDENDCFLDMEHYIPQSLFC